MSATMLMFRRQLPHYLSFQLRFPLTWRSVTVTSGIVISHVGAHCKLRCCMFLRHLAHYLLFAHGVCSFYERWDGQLFASETKSLRVTNSSCQWFDANIANKKKQHCVATLRCHLLWVVCCLLRSYVHLCCCVGRFFFFLRDRTAHNRNSGRLYIRTTASW